MVKMPRAVWSGSLSFGLVNIPVKAYVATKDRSISFKMLCGKCHTPLQYKRWCPNCKKEVPWKDIDRGYKLTKDQFVVLTEEELEGLQLKSTKTIDIHRFVDGGAIDSLYLDKHYYLVPIEGGEKAYSLLHDVLALASKVAIGKMTMRNKEHVVGIRPYQQGLLMTTLRYPNEIVPMDTFEELGNLVESRERELDLAKALVKSMTGDFEPEKYTDEYRKAVMEMIKQKVEGVEVEVEKLPEVEKTKDLMRALKASVQTVKKETE